MATTTAAPSTAAPVTSGAPTTATPTTTGGPTTSSVPTSHAPTVAFDVAPVDNPLSLAVIVLTSVYAAATLFTLIGNVIWEVLGPTASLLPWQDTSRDTSNGYIRNIVFWLLQALGLLCYTLLISAMGGAPTESPVVSLTDNDLPAQLRLWGAILLGMGVVFSVVNVFVSFYRRWSDEHQA